MQYIAALTLLAGAVSAAAGHAAASDGAVYVTEVVTAYTTYCPEATTVHAGNKTYTVTAPTTLTITDCPCTITKKTSAVPPKGTGVWTSGAAKPTGGIFTTKTPGAPITPSAPAKPSHTIVAAGAEKVAVPAVVAVAGLAAALL